MPTAPKLAFDQLAYPTVIVVGGGFAGLRVVRGLAGRPYKVMLLDQNNHHCFQPLLYQVATASLSADSIAHPFRRTVAPMANVAFRMDPVLAVHPAEKCVETAHGRMSYDILVLATGSKTNFFGMADVEHEAMQLKNISQALDIRSDFLQDFEAALFLQDEVAQMQRLNFVIVGGGPTGVELAGAMAEIKRNVLRHEYREMEPDRMRIHLIDSNPRVLSNFSEASSARAKSYLERMGVNVLLGRRVTNFDGERLTFMDGSTMESNTVIWAAGVRGVDLPGMASAVEEPIGRYRVNAFGQVEGHLDIFALGDVALMTGDPGWPKGHPQVAQAAIQQAEHLVRNLVRRARGQAMQGFRYRDKGSMATIGRGKAVVDIGRFTFGGIVAWVAWMVVHVVQLIGFRNRMMVLVNWAWKYVSWRNTIRLIIRPYVRRSASFAPAPEIRS